MAEGLNSRPFFLFERPERGARHQDVPTNAINLLVIKDR
jgi:hypothetical protein